MFITLVFKGYVILVRAIALALPWDLFKLVIVADRNYNFVVSTLIIRVEDPVELPVVNCLSAENIIAIKVAMMVHVRNVISLKRKNAIVVKQNVRPNVVKEIPFVVIKISMKSLMSGLATFLVIAFVHDHLIVEYIVAIRNAIPILVKLNHARWILQKLKGALVVHIQ